MQNKSAWFSAHGTTTVIVVDDIEEGSLFMGPDIVPACDSVTLPGM
jgi:hypothetical protein